MLIIGWGHRQKTGKDTASKLLAAELKRLRPDLSVIRAGFADKMKDVAYDLYSYAGLMPRGHYEAHPDEKDTILTALDMTVRQVWIKTGMAMRRGVHENTWINYLAKNNKADVLLIPDVRFQNEAEVIHDADGILIKVNRKAAPVSNDEADVALDAFEDWDFNLPNNGTLDDLRVLVTDLYQKIAGRLP